MFSGRAAPSPQTRGDRWWCVDGNRGPWSVGRSASSGAYRGGGDSTAETTQKRRWRGQALEKLSPAAVVPRPATTAAVRAAAARGSIHQ
uniref:Uncharacterized protein n=1 Tax=Human herpesvirus 2 TaxID=10310 RepID=A0A481TFU8_HHV2|nr:hypothetical protein [Human alphaherpesvirus 2]QBH80158.1 hypothetical protein [Human alphaherpesvirus 2]QBH85196.1 hypothetical protein [Human alphaherpesvirus 2]